MPLDGHSYLVSQGWTGKGTGLRQGAITRPLTVPQKKTLAGLGKERDEAFPFWDHLFSAASKSIQIKISGDDEDSDDSEPTASTSLKRTTTGILSNRRPVTGTLTASSGATTPDVEDTSPRLSLLATAKREAAKRGLYSRFFRGPVLGPDSPLTTTGVVEDVAISIPPPVVTDIVEDCGEKEKKRKVSNGEEDDGERRERKRQKKAKKELERAEKKSKEKKNKGKEKEKDATAATPDAVDKMEKKKKSKDKEKEREAAGAAATFDKAEKKKSRKQESDVDADESSGKKEKKRRRDSNVEETDGSEEAGKKARRKEEKRRSKLKTNSPDAQPDVPVETPIAADLQATKTKRKRKRSDSA